MVPSFRCECIIEAIDKAQTMLERGFIYLNSEGYVELSEKKDKEIQSQLGYSRIGRNNV